MAGETILVVDDDRQIVRLLKRYLEQAGYRVTVAYDGQGALSLLHGSRSDLLLLDLGLPDRDGWEVTQTIREDRRVATIPIIMLTARIDDADKITGLELGADDYITKPFNTREVVARVRAVLRRKQWEKDEPLPIVLRSGGMQLDVDSRSFSIDGEIVDLTPTEFKLMRTLMESPAATFHREELLEKALGYGYEGQGRTLDSHIKNLRQKIEPDPGQPKHILTVHGVGYRFNGQK